MGRGSDSISMAAAWGPHQSDMGRGGGLSPSIQSLGELEKDQARRMFMCSAFLGPVKGP